MAVARANGSRRELPATLVELATNRLRDAILSGNLKPGEKILEEQLCVEFGISRAPLREALRLLSQQGLVEHLPRRGSRVTDWSPSDILQLFALRHVLERHAVETALPMRDPESALEGVRTALDRMCGATDELGRDDAHRRFHAAVVELADNRQLNIALQPILLKLQLPMAMNLRHEAHHHRADDGIRRHQAIVAALATNDPATAMAALDDHGEKHYLDLDLHQDR
jgi:DNA-binding GntR family transcriptional regulator